MMADIAAIFHWGPDVLDAMPLEQLAEWHGMAVDRWNRMQGGKE